MSTPIIHHTAAPEGDIQKCSKCGDILTELASEGAWETDIFLMQEDRGGGCTAFTPIAARDFLRMLPIILETRPVMCDESIEGPVC